jgi:GAF domain-containing protein
VAIFLIDDKKEYAVLRAANSPGGQRMLARGHRLAVGQVGIVGYVAEQAKPRISLDVGAEPIFFDNPDLPETHSEMALPLVAGQEVIGVLDVQSEQPAAFTHQDMIVMSTLADQVTIAIENARRFTETRQALDEARAFYSQYLRQSWQQVPLEAKGVGYQYRNTMVVPIPEHLDFPEIHSAIKTGEQVMHTDKNPALALPLKLRGEVIGVLDIRSAKPSYQWTENEQAIVQAIAERVTLAIENARLFEETTRRADRERTVSEITTSIRSTTDPDEMLQTALDELKRVLGASDIRVRPYQPPPATQPPEEVDLRKKKATRPAKDVDRSNP